MTSSLFDLQEQFGQRHGPHLLFGVRLFNEDQLSEPVSVAQAVAALLKAGGGKITVSDERASELRQYPELIMNSSQVGKSENEGD